MRAELLQPLASGATCRCRRCSDRRSPMLLILGGAAAKVDGARYKGKVELLHPLASGATRRRRRCYDRWPPLLLLAGGAATMVDSACYKCKAELLLHLANGATCHRRRCCQSWPPLLEGRAPLLRPRSSGATCRSRCCCRRCSEASRRRWVRAGACGIRDRGEVWWRPEMGATGDGSGHCRMPEIGPGWRRGARRGNGGECTA